MVFFKTEFNGYSVKFSPFDETKVAAATSQNFGIVGRGKLDIFHSHLDGRILPINGFYTKDGLYDCAWSEESEFHLATCSGDGSVMLWDIRRNEGQPVKGWSEHLQEVYAIDWNVQRKNSFLTASWDRSIKLWSPGHPQSISTFLEHEYNVYAAMWDPHSPDIFASASGDKTVKVWDARAPRSVQTIPAHPMEVLSLDWNKYAPSTFVTASVDKTIKTWDMRRAHEPLAVLHGHSYAIRRVKCSPHRKNILMSVSYDRTCCVWDLDRPEPLVERSEHHTEFAVGCDFNLFVEGRVATCGWDSHVALWNLGSNPRM